MSKQELEQSTGAAADNAASLAGVMPGRRLKLPDPALLERLAETGFLATEFGLHEQAESIFICLAKLKRGKPSPRIALAMVQARRGRMTEAIDALRNVIEQHPESELARAVLGSMLVHIGESEGRELLNDVVARGVDSDAVNVAVSCIDQARAQQLPVQPEPPAPVEYFRHYNIRA
jgi:hypothetical protein